MKKTSTPAAAALAITVSCAASIWAATPAAAATECLGTSQTKIIGSGAQPVSVVIGTTVPRNLTLFSQVEDPCTAAVSAEVLLENSSLSDAMEQVDRVGNIASFQAGYRIDPHDLTNGDAGAWQGDLTAHGTTEAQATVDFRLLRASRLTVDAGPEPARRGETITVQGVLTRASWDTRSYRGMQRAVMTLETRRPRDSTYVPLKTVSTDSKGRVAVALKAHQDVCFRFVYAGSGTTAPVASGGDCVAVR